MKAKPKAPATVAPIPEDVGGWHILETNTELRDGTYAHEELAREVMEGMRADFPYANFKLLRMGANHHISDRYFFADHYDQMEQFKPPLYLGVLNKLCNAISFWCPFCRRDHHHDFSEAWRSRPDAAVVVRVAPACRTACGEAVHPGPYLISVEPKKAKRRATAGVAP